MKEKLMENGRKLIGNQKTKKKKNPLKKQKKKT